jgi:hypothetical protein
MSELAYNINGEAFEVPANATGWRVRRMRAKGAPEVVYGRDGTPLVLPIDAELDELRSEVDVSGRYRLDLVDQNNKALASAPSGYVQVNHETSPVTNTTSAMVVSGTSDSIVLEAMRMNMELAKSVVDRFPQMMEAAAVLLQAADGAGLPARLPIPRIDDEDDDEEDDDETGDATSGEPKPAGFDMNAMLAQLVPVVLGAFATGKIKMPDLGSVLDWRKAGKHASKPTPATQTPATEPAPSPSSSLPTLDPAAMAHVIAVQSALEPQEVAYVQAIAKEFTPAELRGWFDELSKLSVPDAVTRIRGLIAGKNGGAS